MGFVPNYATISDRCGINTDMFGKAAIIELVMIIVLAIAGLVYFRYTENIIAVLHENTAKLQDAVSIQQATIKAQQDAAIQQAAASFTLQQNVSAAETTRRQLENSLKISNIAAMARANSADLEQRINIATSTAFVALEKLTTPQDRPAQSQSNVPAVDISPTTSAKSTTSNYQPPPRPPVTYSTGVTLQ